MLLGRYMMVFGVSFAVGACLSARFERAEDAWCSDVKRDVPRLSSGPLQASAMAAEQACDLEEAFERDGGSP